MTRRKLSRYYPESFPSQPSSSSSMRKRRPNLRPDLTRRDLSTTSSATEPPYAGAGSVRRWCASNSTHHPWQAGLAYLAFCCDPASLMTPALRR
ncbi:hypothetical protein C8J57DRAFT_1534905 [Mycena rebaudengoi]|nr:hypothetical protein C8J57DRAFT_1534905 [Mycena rebaudengoi]